MNRAFRQQNNEHNTHYPKLLGTRGAVATEHYLSTKAGADLLGVGGNAVDAAVGATLVECVVNPQMATLGGECPMLICMASSREVVAVNGNTAAPGLATPEAYQRRGLRQVPDEGILASGVPATLSALVTALTQFGRLSFAEVAAPALDYAKNGFPVHTGLYAAEGFGIRNLAEKFSREWPGSAQLYSPQGVAVKVGDLLVNSALADLLDHLIMAEKTQSGDRKRGLEAVLESFYKGEPAKEIDAFSKERDGLLARSDLECFQTHCEKPVSLQFANTTVFKCDTWNQGPVMLQALAMLETFDLKKMGHNSVDYIHCTTEVFKLAFADREQYYADPTQVDVPIDELLSKEYACMRSALVDPKKASSELRPGDPKRQRALLPMQERLGGAAWGPGAVHVDVIDGDGNMAAFSPSGGWLKSAEVVSALGFPLGNRMMTFYLEPSNHPNIVAPFKRPRTTVSPSLAFRDGHPWMVFGSMGGDQQDQWQCQFYLNQILFGMSIQEAIEAPKYSSEHFPGFFAPHESSVNLLRIEPRLGQEIIDGLTQLGHQLQLGAEWSEGYLLAAARDPTSGILEAGCDPRGAKGEVFPACALCW